MIIDSGLIEVAPRLELLSLAGDLEIVRGYSDLSMGGRRCTGSGYHLHLGIYCLLQTSAMRRLVARGGR